MSNIANGDDLFNFIIVGYKEKKGKMVPDGKRTGWDYVDSEKALVLNLGKEKDRYGAYVDFSTASTGYGHLTSITIKPSSQLNKIQGWKQVGGKDKNGQYTYK